MTQRSQWFVHRPGKLCDRRTGSGARGASVAGSDSRAGQAVGVGCAEGRCSGADRIVVRPGGVPCGTTPF
ncbi:hypothetical protein P376_5940 [Streptomyces sp. HCCB10043]|nr:hypothetical protein P376_5940 [Streptomyces sp. HCCB10043]